MSRSFCDFLRDINGGAFAEELSEGLAELIGSVKATDKGGALSLTIKLKPARGGKLMEVEHACSFKSPEFERPVDYMFPTDDNALVRDNPEQRKLDLRLAGAAPAPFDLTTGEILTLSSAAQTSTP